ncbi:MAG: hypothetical protein KBA61_11510 [Spirochaetes bacterium]|nr:hypothetical protein [Spirochaetota bacterium]
MAQATSLLKAYNNRAIPTDGAVIITSSFDPASIYSIYEITACARVESVAASSGGLLFNARGRRAHLLVEPAGHELRDMEPYARGEGRAIPWRFVELHHLAGKHGERILLPREPGEVPAPFVVAAVGGDNFAFLFFRTEDLFPAIGKFMADVLYNDSGLERDDAIRAAALLMETVEKINLW